MTRRRRQGLSGTMYGYEGLGCISWHMVSKLLLAVQEVHAEAVRAAAPPEVVRGLARAYYRVRRGLGFNKSAEVYGAFPTDPSSHTPAHAGAQQPGMTGSVKEEVLTRRGELGVEVRSGRLRFRPTLLQERELLQAPGEFTFVTPAGATVRRLLHAGELGFTVCQVPIIYRLAERRAHEVRWSAGPVEQVDGDVLGERASAAILRRTGEVAEVIVSIPVTDLLTEATA